jgi:ubiquinone/menaquinone biosynthesis C-methylase UbiE
VSAAGGWQLDDSAAVLYERYLVPAMTALWAADLVERSGLSRGDAALDAACGTGTVARAAAQRVGKPGRVAAVDINAGMIAVARSLPAGDGARIEWFESSVLALPFEDAAFSVVLCQFGLQFFPDPLAALAEIRRVVRIPGGRLALNVFGPIEQNVATCALAGALDRHVRPGAAAVKRSEHAFSDGSRLRRLVDGAGFHRISLQTHTKMVLFPSAADYVRVQLAATPLAALLAETDGRQTLQWVEAVTADVESALAPYVDDDGLRFPQVVHVLVAET